MKCHVLHQIFQLNGMRDEKCDYGVRQTASSKLLRMFICGLSWFCFLITGRPVSIVAALLEKEKVFLQSKLFFYDFFFDEIVENIGYIFNYYCYLYNNFRRFENSRAPVKRSPQRQDGTNTNDTFISSTVYNKHSPIQQFVSHS